MKCMDTCLFFVFKKKTETFHVHFQCLRIPLFSNIARALSFYGIMLESLVRFSAVLSVLSPLDSTHYFASTEGGKLLGKERGHRKREKASAQFCEIYFFRWGNFGSANWKECRWVLAFSYSSGRLFQRLSSA